MANELLLDTGGLVSIIDQAQRDHGQFAGFFNQWDGEIVSGEFVERNDFYELIGIANRQYRLTFRFENDLIREIRLTPAKDSGPKTTEALEPFLAWAAPRHPAVLDEIYPDGQLVFDSRSAEQWLALLREWNKDTGVRTQARVAK